MSKTLPERLADSKVELLNIDAALTLHAAKIPTKVSDRFREILSFTADIEHMLGIIDARSAARQLLTGLETQADPADDTVPFGATRAKYQHVRLIGVQAYLSTSWALADRLSSMAASVLCTPSGGGSEGARSNPLVSLFLNVDRKKHTASALFESIRQTFGWPIAVSYALRNHFIHDGAQTSGTDFFHGPTSTANFIISDGGWIAVQDKALNYGAEQNHHRLGPAGWIAGPRTDLRAVLDMCEREMDDALGVLVGSATMMLRTHVGFVLGQD